jgi:D-arabinose 1-dehydrogenase-like Zn-dependent alcohol dehydrogenase
MCLNPKIAGLQESFSDDGELVKKVTFRIGDREIVKSIRVPCRSCVECVSRRKLLVTVKIALLR